MTRSSPASAGQAAPKRARHGRRTILASVTILIVSALVLVYAKVSCSRGTAAPQGKLKSITLRVNPRRWAERMGVDDCESLEDKEFSVRVQEFEGVRLWGRDLGELWEGRHESWSERPCDGVEWEYPSCEVRTDRGTFTLRIHPADSLYLLKRMGAFRFVYDRGDTRPALAAHSWDLTDAVRRTVQADPEMRESFRRAVALFWEEAERLSDEIPASGPTTSPGHTQPGT